MTGLELIAVKGNQICLFKVRHDGYAIEEYIALMKKPKGKTPAAAIKHFKKWFHNPEKFGGDGLDTNFPDGYSFSSSETKFDKILKEAHQQVDDFAQTHPIEGEVHDGLACSYSDYQVIIDLNDNSFKQKNWKKYIIPFSVLERVLHDKENEDLTDDQIVARVSKDAKLAFLMQVSPFYSLYFRVVGMPKGLFTGVKTTDELKKRLGKVKIDTANPAVAKIKFFLETYWSSYEPLPKEVQKNLLIQIL